MISIKKIVVGDLKANCYLLYSSNKECIIVDPGYEAELIKNVMIDLKLKPKTIVCTHGHFDHLLAVTELKLALNIPFLIHKKDEFLVRNSMHTANHYLKVEAPPAPVIDSYIKKGNFLYLNQNKISVIETPGHTPGSISLCFAPNGGSKLLFTGDLLFARGAVGRTDFHYSNKSTLIKSIKKIVSYPPNTLVYPGHGNTFKINQARKYFKYMLN